MKEKYIDIFLGIFKYDYPGEYQKLLKTINTPRKLIFLLVVAVVMVKFPLMFVRFFDTDELLHIHDARSIYHGLLPYRDFFEHHTPYMHYMLAPLFMILGDSITTIFTARIIMFFFVIGIFFVTFKLARILYGKKVALFSIFFLSIEFFFFDQSLDVRPDVPAVLIWIMSVIFLVRGVQDLNSNQRIFIPKRNWFKSIFTLLWSNSVVRNFFLSGILVGISIMFTQKMLFALIGISISQLWFIIDARISAKRADRFYLCSMTALGAMIIFLITSLYFFANGGFYDFIYDNFIINLKWHSFAPYNNISEFFRRNPFFSVFSLFGVAVATFSLREKENIVQGIFLPLFPMYFLIYGLFIITSPAKNYYMAFIPFLAIYAGLFLSNFENFFYRILNARQMENSKSFNYLNVIFVTVFSLITAWIVYYSRFGEESIISSNLLHMAVWIVVILTSAIVLWRKRLEYLTFLLILGFAVYPLNQMLVFFEDKYSNREWLNQLRYILNNTTSDDYVLDGWTGLGVLRNHVYYYHFLHFEVRKLLTKKERTEDVINALEKTKPKIVIFDLNIIELSPVVRNYVISNYVSAGPRGIMVRKEYIDLKKQ